MLEKRKLIETDKTTFWIGSSFALGTVIYFLSFGWLNLNADAGIIVWREQLILSSGAVAWVLMTLCMLIAIRPACLERWMGGLDRAYFLHKWAGIWAVIVSILHWVFDLAGRWMVQLGWIIRPAGGGADERPVWLMLGKATGEIGMYIFIAFALIALIKIIPYRLFQKTHKVISILYLVIGYHALVMLPAQWWATPAAYIILLTYLMGAWCAVLALTNTFNRSSRYKGMVKQLDQNETGVIDMQIEMAPNQAMQYMPGQFAFINFGSPYGAHPFTIVSFKSQMLRFIIKPLGDFTNKMTELISLGQEVEVQGPYGQFTFQSKEKNQVWVGAGVGVTPFISRLGFLAEQGGADEKIDFWYCTRTQKESQFPQELKELCKQANVRLHFVVSEQGQRLTAQTILETSRSLPSNSLESVSVWFSGPRKFATELKQGLMGMGLLDGNFHAELFNFR